MSMLLLLAHLDIIAELAKQKGGGAALMESLSAMSVPALRKMLIQCSCKHLSTLDREQVLKIFNVRASLSPHCTHAHTLRSSGRTRHRAF
jgi:hypothetical protein